MTVISRETVSLAQACFARRQVHDQLWGHRANGSIRAVCRVVAVGQAGAVFGANPQGGAVGGGAVGGGRPRSSPGVDVDSDANEAVYSERGSQRRFLFDRVFDASTPTGASLVDLDGLVCDAAEAWLVARDGLSLHSLAVLPPPHHLPSLVPGMESAQVPFVAEGDNVCVFSSATPDTAVEAANALHDRALRCVFDVAAALVVSQGASSVGDRHTAEGQHQVRLATMLTRRLSIDWVESCNVQWAGGGGGGCPL